MKQQFHRVTWITEIHRNFFGTGNHDEADYHQAVENIRRTNPGAVLLNTDFAESSELIQYLEQLQYDLGGCPLYFTLGNHTRGNSIRQIRLHVQEYFSAIPTITYLGACDLPVPLTESVALVGYDGWSETRFDQWDVAFEKIKKDSPQQHRQAKWHRPSKRLDAAASKAAAHLFTILTQATRQFPIVILLAQLPLWLK